MEKIIELKISSDGDVLIPWYDGNFKDLIDILKSDIGQEDEIIQILYGAVYCG